MSDYALYPGVDIEDIPGDENKKSLKEKLVNYLEEPANLQQIYGQFPNEKPSSIRGRLNENIDRCFKRLSKGIYLAVSGETKAVIVEGDAWEKIKDLEDNSIDTIITDSPYSCLNKHYEIGTTRTRNLNKNIGFQTRDMDQELLKEMFRVLKPNGHFFCFLPSNAKDTYEYNTNLIHLAIKQGFNFNKTWVWDKVVIGMGYNGRNRHEQIVFLSKGERRKPYNLAIPDVLTHKRIPADKRIHNAEKPVELIEDIMKFSNKKGDVVLDTFAGSLSVAKAGFNQLVHTISIEIDGAMIQRAVQMRGLRASVLESL